MIYKDKVLPLVDFLAVVANWDDGPDIAGAAAEAQRDADLVILERDYMPKERVKPLIGALMAIRDSREDNLKDYAVFCEETAREALAQFDLEEVK